VVKGKKKEKRYLPLRKTGISRKKLKDHSLGFITNFLPFMHSLAVSF